jgi:hypothetical protein
MNVNVNNLSQIDTSSPPLTTELPPLTTEMIKKFKELTNLKQETIKKTDLDKLMTTFNDDRADLSNNREIIMKNYGYLREFVNEFIDTFIFFTGNLKLKKKKELVSASDYSLNSFNTFDDNFLYANATIIDEQVPPDMNGYIFDVRKETLDECWFPNVSDEKQLEYIFKITSNLFRNIWSNPIRRPNIIETLFYKNIYDLKNDKNYNKGKDIIEKQIELKYISSMLFNMFHFIEKFTLPHNHNQCIKNLVLYFLYEFNKRRLTKNYDNDVLLKTENRIILKYVVSIFNFLESNSVETYDPTNDNSFEEDFKELFKKMNLNNEGNKLNKNVIDANVELVDYLKNIVTYHLKKMEELRNPEETKYSNVDVELSDNVKSLFHPFYDKMPGKYKEHKELFEIDIYDYLKKGYEQEIHNKELKRNKNIN